MHGCTLRGDVLVVNYLFHSCRLAEYVTLYSGMVSVRSQSLILS